MPTPTSDRWLGLALTSTDHKQEVTFDPSLLHHAPQLIEGRGNIS